MSTPGWHDPQMPDPNPQAPPAPPWPAPGPGDPTAWQAAPAGPPGWQSEPMGPPGWQQPDPMGSGGYGVPQKSGPNPGLLIMIGVIVLVAVGGLAYFLTSGDDDDDGQNVSSQREQQQEEDTPADDGPILPGGDEPSDDENDPPVTEPEDDSDPGDIDLGDLPESELVATTGDWVYVNTPLGVDESEADCIAAVVIQIVGPDRVAAEDGDLRALYATTTTDEDAQISEAYPSCLDSDSASTMASEGWIW
jgi:hypothetical protein